MRDEVRLRRFKAALASCFERGAERNGTPISRRLAEETVERLIASDTDPAWDAILFGEEQTRFVVEQLRGMQ